MFLPQEIIRKKRDSKKLTLEEIETFVDGIDNWTISDGQIAAFTMSVVLNGMNKEEIVNLTKSYIDTGMVLDWTSLDLDAPVVSSITTGGVGDKTDLLFAPILAACGAYVPMINGRGMAHTGGTLDKIEAIPNYNSSPSSKVFRQIIKDFKASIIGATAEFTSVVRRIYPIRDVTATVNSIALTTASILAQTIAVGIKDAFVMDSKFGNGTFTESMEETIELAESIVHTGCALGLPTSSVITDMNQVSGHTAGNALEIEETIEFLTNKRRDKRLEQIIIDNCSEALLLCKIETDKQSADNKILEVLNNGKAAECFDKISYGAGGAKDIIENYDKILPKAEFIGAVYPDEEGVVQSMNTRWIGLSVSNLGAGRKYLADRIDYSVGVSEFCQIGDFVDNQKPLAIIHANSEEAFKKAQKEIKNSIVIDDKKIEPSPVIYGTVRDETFYN